MSISIVQFIPPSLPLGNHKFVFLIYISISVLYISSFVSPFFRFHNKWYNMIFVFLYLTYFTQCDNL